MRDLYEKYKEQVAIVQQGERLTIDATKQGSAERLQAIEDAMAREEADGLQDTAFYKQLSIQKLETQREMTEQQVKFALQSQEEEIRAREQMGQEEARHQAAMAQLKNGSGNGAASAGDSIHIALERQQLELEYQIKREALREQLDLYKQAGADQVKQAMQTQQQLDELNKNYADRSQELQLKQRQAEKNYWADYANTAAQSLLTVAEGRESLARLSTTLADQALSKTLQGIIQEIAGNKTLQLSHAEAAAAGAFKAMSGIPIIGPELGAVSAAAVFAGAMAFESGTDRVPGVGRGDIVPAMLEPGEGVVPGGVMDGLRHIAQHGGFQGGRSVTVHLRPTYHVQTIDGDGMKAALEKHTDQLQQHFESTLRKQNR